MIENNDNSPRAICYRKLLRAYCEAGERAIAHLIDDVQPCPVCGSDRCGDIHIDAIVSDLLPNDEKAVPSDILTFARTNGMDVYDCETCWECQECGFGVRYGMYTPLTDQDAD